MILKLTDTKASSYLIDHGYIADVSPVRRSDYGAQAVVTDRKGGTHWVTNTVDEIYELIVQAEAGALALAKLVVKKP